MNQNLRQFLIRLGVFLAAFVALSVALGPLIVNTSLLSKYHFATYGGLGYLVLFMAIAFVAMSRIRLATISIKSNVNPALVVLTFILAALFYWYGSYIGANQEALAASYMSVLISSHALFLAIFVILALAVFGAGFIKEFALDYSKELLICLALAVAFYVLMGIVWSSWEILSNAVTRVVYAMLQLTFPDTTLIPPRGIAVEGFSAKIEEACSGVYSMFLFTSLYLLIAIVDHKILNLKRVAMLFAPALVGVFFVNTIRIYLLFVVGVLISPDFARNMFHSYIGTLLFIVYFLLFIIIFYPWMKKTPTATPKHTVSLARIDLV